MKQVESGPRGADFGESAQVVTLITPSLLCLSGLGCPLGRKADYKLNKEDPILVSPPPRGASVQKWVHCLQQGRWWIGRLCRQKGNLHSLHHCKPPAPQWASMDLCQRFPIGQEKKSAVPVLLAKLLISRKHQVKLFVA